MRDGFRVFDCDLHTMEPDSLWRDHLDARFVHRLPSGSGADPYRRHSPESHLEAMNREGIDVGVLFGTRGRHLQMHDDLDAGYADALARAQNDWTAGFCARDPARLKFAAQIGYHDVALAVHEVERAVSELGAVAVIGNPNPVAGRHLQDSELDPLWSAIETLGVPLCFHPSGVWTLKDDVGRRFHGHRGARSIADSARNPMETMLAFASLVAGGVLERHPRLVCVFLECTCAWLPWWLWRLEDTLVKFPDDADVDLSLSPSGYFRRQCFVAAESGERHLAETIAAIGDDRILFASDYPHRDSAYPNAVSGFLARTDLTIDSKRNILWNTPLRAFPTIRSMGPAERASAASRTSKDAGP